MIHLIIQVDDLLNLLNSLIIDQKDQIPNNAIDEDEDFIEQQTLVARLINLIQGETPDQIYLV